jgi:hypothetical protein
MYSTPVHVEETPPVYLGTGSEQQPGDGHAEADVYGGGCTTLGLVATSQHPLTRGPQE